jgi:hypothetical protein
MTFNRKFTRRQIMQTGAAAVIAGQIPRMAQAQEFKPPKAVTMSCPYPPGGLGDATARTLAKGLSELWKVPVVVDNKAGATGMIAAAAVAKGPADGTMLLCMLPEALSVAKALKAPIGFDVSTDLQPIALSVVSGCVMATNSKGRFQTYQELVKFAVANPGELNFGIQGPVVLSISPWSAGPSPRTSRSRRYPTRVARPSSPTCWAASWTRCSSPHRWGCRILPTGSFARWS